MASTAKVESSMKVLALVLSGLLLGGFFVALFGGLNTTVWVFGLGLALLGAVLLIVGVVLMSRSRSRWLPAGSLTLGAILGAITTIWAVLPVVAALALIVMSFYWASHPARAS